MTLAPPTAGLPDGPDLDAAEITFRWLARPFAFLDECAAAFGDAFTLRFTRFGTHVVVSHPDDVRAVFTADPDALHAGRGNAPLAPVLGRHSLLLVDGERHAAQRAVLQPAFRSERVQPYARVVAEATRRRTVSWAADGRANLQRTALAISREVVLRAVCGIPDGEVDRFSALVHQLMALVETNATFEAGATDPRLLARFAAARAALAAALQDHVDQRRRAASPGDDVLGMLLAAGPASDDEVRDQLITMILAGHETTASAITWALLALHDAPAALDAVRRELDDGPADHELGGLPFLQAVCLETLRLRPVIPVVSREVVRPLRLRAGILPPGVFVTPCAYLAHRRPDVFPEPEAFRPERFLGRRFSPYAYFPFGGGARRCIGMGFALLEMQIVVGMLLRAFAFAPVEAPPVRPLRRAVTIVPSGGGRMRVEPRPAVR